ncbi:hypothetical protein RB199_38680 [Streptomyces libani]|uniref:Uncharacterized protein n=1 Tax=Streptomyces nigrescens TaxID=1920 RepID=A0A640TB98_STRNI|nr:hypothetical protein [Streptomyces libani]WAT94486.1 hypothetical protein STRLI_000106 [Streptomyces libani subsp. libani]GFE19566.1 hypothetical protein Sliba_00190 [Streptomyces libani subsp. libani]GGW04668.1 hypothetical protein GCM10010500_67230 [Streptomyces libani subsp. libani]
MAAEAARVCGFASPATVLHYGETLVGVEPAPFMVDIGCVHRTVRLWNRKARSPP